MSAAADALGIARLAAALALPRALGVAAAEPAGAWLPLGLVVGAAATDFVDGPLARRAGGATRHGAALDNLADVALVLAATGAGAGLGLVSWAAPATIAAAFAGYAVASLRRTARVGRWQLARSRIGHAAGVVNYVLAGLIAGAVALPDVDWRRLLAVGSALVVLLNGAAVAARLLARRG